MGESNGLARAIARALRKRLPLRAIAEYVTRPQSDDIAKVYRDDPLGYIANVLKMTLTEDQAKIAADMPGRVKVNSGHSVGKTSVCAAIVNWWWDTRDPGVIITTAPTERDVIDLLWTEIRLQRIRANLPSNFSGPRAPEMYSSPEHWAKGYTARKSESFHGRHRAYMLFVFDESEGIDSHYWTSLDTMYQPDQGHAVLVVGNPLTTSSQSYIEDLACNPDGSPKWKLHTLSSLNHPNIRAQLLGKPAPIPSAVTLPMVRQWVQDWTTPVPHAADRLESDVEFPPRLECPDCARAGAGIGGDPQSITEADASTPREKERDHERERPVEKVAEGGRPSAEDGGILSARVPPHDDIRPRENLETPLVSLCDQVPNVHDGRNEAIRGDADREAHQRGGLSQRGGATLPRADVPGSGQPGQDLPDSALPIRVGGSGGGTPGLGIGGSPGVPGIVRPHDEPVRSVSAVDDANGSDNELVPPSGERQGLPGTEQASGDRGGSEQSFIGAVQDGTADAGRVQPETDCPSGEQGHAGGVPALSGDCPCPRCHGSGYIGGGTWIRPGPLFKCRAMGLRPTSGVDTIFSELEWAAMTNPRGNLYAEWQRGSGVTIGVDVATYGDDDSCFHVRIGGVSVHHEYRNGWLPNRTAEHIRMLSETYAQYYNSLATDDRPPLRPEEVLTIIEMDGPGVGVYSLNDGWNWMGLIVSERADDPQHYTDRRSEMWFNARDLARCGCIDVSRLSGDVLTRLRFQLLAPSYQVLVGRTRVESKKDFKKRLRRSPDDADAFVISHYKSTTMMTAVLGDTSSRTSWAVGSQTPERVPAPARARKPL